MTEMEMETGLKLKSKRVKLINHRFGLFFLCHFFTLSADRELILSWTLGPIWLGMIGYETGTWYVVCANRSNDSYGPAPAKGQSARLC